MWWLGPVIGGSLIVLFTLREIYQDLFHPSQSGALSDWIGSGLFRLFRRWPPMLSSAGPLTVVTVIFTWALLLAIGFALIYWSVFPAAFQLKTGGQPAAAERFWWSFYYSLQMLTTLGLGDIQPNPTWLKILSAIHTLLGFSLVTASITWFVLLFPALSRMRTLARKAAVFADAEQETGVSAAAPGMHVVLAGLAEEVVRTRVDLMHSPILFYFYAADRRASLPHALYPLLDAAERGKEPGRDDLVRFMATALWKALVELADSIGEQIGIEDRRPEIVFRAFADMHTPAS